MTLRAVRRWWRRWRRGRHRYTSTACLHGRHDYCAAMVGYQGVKRPGQCKWCDAQCECPQHANPDAACVGEDEDAAPATQAP